MTRTSSNIEQIKKLFQNSDTIVDKDDHITITTPCHNISINQLFIEDQTTKCPTCAYAIRHVAIDVNQTISGRINKAKAQRLWLKHCLSKETDYTFIVLKEAQKERGEREKIVEREKDVETIVKEGLKNGAALKNFIDSDEGVKFYKKTIADWYLRRYNGKMAKDILKPFDYCDKLKLFYPRLIVAIIIGLLALMAGQEGWDLPHKLANRIDYWGLIGVSIGFLTISILYLKYECYNIIFDKKKALLRALKVGLFGFGASLIFSTIICITIGSISVTKKIINPDTYYSLQAGWPVFKNIFFFASVALFIGIFMQVFWEKETITEPL